MNETHALCAKNIRATLTAVLREDKNTNALAAALASALEARAEELQKTLLYARIDELPEELVDILARDFKIDWYDYDHTPPEKRKTLRESFAVHRHLGTRYAVTTALSTIYPVNRICEWFEYGGTPHAFRLYVDATELVIDAERSRRALEMVRFYKNLRSYLERIEYEMRAEEDAVLRLDGQLSCVVELHIPEQPDEIELRSELAIGTSAGRMLTLGIPTGAESTSFQQQIHMGGNLTRAFTLAIPCADSTDQTFEEGASE